MSTMGFREQVAAAVTGTTIHSLTSYTWFGRRSAAVSQKFRKFLTEVDLRSYGLYSLRLHLYGHFYCRGFAAPTVIESIHQLESPNSALDDFVERLSEANCGTGFCRNGWEVVALGEDRALVCKNGQHLRVAAGNCVSPAGVPITPGLHVGVRFPKEFAAMSPGFYMACSDHEMSFQELIRFYWNLTPEGAVRFLRSATRNLNRAGIPFKLKVLNNPHRFTRCDGTVLYVEKSRHGPALLNILEELYEDLADAIRIHVPLFTKPLADGLALAEDPGSTESFGMHRCGLLADGLLRAFERRERSFDQRMKAVEERFTEDGFDFDRPFLNPGSSDIYSFRRRRRSLLCASTPAARTIRHETFLATAVQLGRRLSQEAIWSGNRCNWLGAETNGDALSGSRFGATCRTLGPDLYGGTAGVALFLIELYNATGDRPILEAALGAIRHAVSQVNSLESPSRLGFYSGVVGIAFSAARTGALIGSCEWLDSAAQLLRLFKSECASLSEFDLISGKAGAIAGLLVLRGLLNDPTLLEVAAALGDALLESAHTSGAHCSWKSSSFESPASLTGFSHGAAGAGFALLELFRDVGRPEFRRGAEMAFQYERTWFDPQSENWPDFREGPRPVRRSRRAPSYCVFWCHGAPGVGLSRLRAYALLGEPALKEESLAAIRTTCKSIESALSAGTENYSLCHGLAGNAELLLEADRVLGLETTRRELALAVGAAGIRAYGFPGRWPCGSGAGETPNLMLGLAGIGRFYLRLHDPCVPSILMPVREDFVKSKPHLTGKATTPTLINPKEKIHAQA